MSLFIGLAASLAAALLLASCGGASPVSTMQSIAYGDPAKAYLGMSKQEVIACAGAPHAKYKMGAAAETLTYHYSGAGPVPAEAKPDKKKKSDDEKAEEKKKSGLFAGIDKKSDKDWTCAASLVFENDRLVRVTFAHKDAESPFAYQGKKDKEGNEAKPEPVKTCVFSLPRCLR
jgi:hypothetical protein